MIYSSNVTTETLFKGYASSVASSIGEERLDSLDSFIGEQGEDTQRQLLELEGAGSGENEKGEDEDV